ncbi:MAG: arsenite methyltransferase, partial [Saprospiraceae bacterium]|nr:arsenite methyltransferase [Saprospiraceae bacterium]
MKMMDLKTEIKNAYGTIAKDHHESASCCSNTSCCGSNESSNMAVDYTQIEGYIPDADLALGCGTPTELAQIKRGDTVVDLGSGAGNDAFVARQIVGDAGKVIGIDMTPEMVIKALQNNQKLGFQNVHFVLGEIEDMQGITSGEADVVISNCVMNLIPDKAKAFQEVHRILKIGGHFSIADIVYEGHLPKGIQEAAEMHVGCIAGASEKGGYLGMIKAAGFKNIQISSERMIDLPDELLLPYMRKDELAEFKKTGSGIYSITV